MRPRRSATSGRYPSRVLGSWGYASVPGTNTRLRSRARLDHWNGRLKPAPIGSDHPPRPRPPSGLNRPGRVRPARAGSTRPPVQPTYLRPTPERAAQAGPNRFRPSTRPSPPAIQPEPAGPGQTSSCWFDPPAGPARPAQFEPEWAGQTGSDWAELRPGLTRCVAVQTDHPGWTALNQVQPGRRAKPVELVRPDSPGPNQSNPSRPTFLATL